MMVICLPVRTLSMSFFQMSAESLIEKIKSEIYLNGANFMWHVYLFNFWIFLQSIHIDLPLLKSNFSIPFSLSLAQENKSCWYNNCCLVMSTFDYFFLEICLLDKCCVLWEKFYGKTVVWENCHIHLAHNSTIKIACFSGLIYMRSNLSQTWNLRHFVSAPLDEKIQNTFVTTPTGQKTKETAALKTNLLDKTDFRLGRKLHARPILHLPLFVIVRDCGRL